MPHAGNAPIVGSGRRRAGSSQRFVPTFWITSSQGIEGSYFVIYQFSRLPREAFKGFSKVLFVWLLPAVIVSNTPANILRHGVSLPQAAWMVAVTLAWFTVALVVFQGGLRRYSSASS